jgi:hypothetical protein
VFFGISCGSGSLETSLGKEYRMSVKDRGKRQIAKDEENNGGKVESNNQG